MYCAYHHSNLMGLDYDTYEQFGHTLLPVEEFGIVMNDDVETGRDAYWCDSGSLAQLQPSEIDL